MVRADAEQVRDQQAAVISGGGSGHEPAHAGYIGVGILSASVLGEVFTSPDTDSIVAVIRAVAGGRGALLVVKNYTGDRLNFGLAAEIARFEGIPVGTAIVHDDVALNGSAPLTRPRGLAGTIFVHKLVGAAAADGESLADVGLWGKVPSSPWQPWVFRYRRAHHLRLGNRALSGAMRKWSSALVSTGNLV